MNKGHKATARTLSWLVVDQPRTVPFKVSQSGANVHPPARQYDESPAPRFSRKREIGESADVASIN